MEKKEPPEYQQQESERQEANYTLQLHFVSPSRPAGLASEAAPDRLTCLKQPAQNESATSNFVLTKGLST